MLSRFKAALQAINASYWFFPAMFVVAAFLLAFVTTWLDHNGYGSWLKDTGFYQLARPEGASNMLSVIATVMISVAATVFSITIAAVAYASGTYGPRLLNNFMEDRGNQLSLATFLGTFVFALTVLRTVRTGDEPAVKIMANTVQAGVSGSGAVDTGFVPQISLLVAYSLMGISVGVLVFFLNHIPASIRINTVLQGIGKRLIAAIEDMFPRASTGQIEMKAPDGQPIRATQTGYIQIIDFEGLNDIAQRNDTILKLAVRPGHFVHPGIALAYWPFESEDIGDTDDGGGRPDKMGDEVRNCFALGGMRTPAQDLHFLIDELVEIGMRALSPGINDPFTAVTSIHWLGAAIAEMGGRDLTRSFGGAENADDDCLILLDDGFAHYLGRSFGAMRSAVSTSTTASIITFNTLAKAAVILNDATRHKDIVKEGHQLMRQARENLTGPDLEMVEARYRRFEKTMDV
ncbi:MAG: DUF2254 domain-containing protein [Pontixanthobacter sp.]